MASFRSQSSNTDPVKMVRVNVTSFNVVLTNLVRGIFLSIKDEWSSMHPSKLTENRNSWQGVKLTPMILQFLNAALLSVVPPNFIMVKLQPSNTQSTNLQFRNPLSVRSQRLKVQSANSSPLITWPA